MAACFRQIECVARPEATSSSRALANSSHIIFVSRPLSTTDGRGPSYPLLARQGGRSLGSLVRYEPKLALCIKVRLEEGVRNHG
jgi:hypothetical protein